MLNKKTVKNILLEVEAANYNYEKNLQSIINILCDDNNMKYLIERENNDLILYTYNLKDFISWLYYECNATDEDINDLIDSYGIIRKYVQQNYIDYYIENNLYNFVNVTKFRKELYNNKSLLYKIINDIAVNVQNCVNNKYLVDEYKLNRYLYDELLKIKNTI